MKEKEMFPFVQKRNGSFILVHTCTENKHDHVIHFHYVTDAGAGN